MSYHPETDSHIRNNVKVVLDLPNYATNTSNLPARKDSIALKVKVNKLDIIKLVTVPIGLKN